MKKALTILLLIFSALFALGNLSATALSMEVVDITKDSVKRTPLSGTRIIGYGGDYQSITAAIIDLNTQGVGNGGITFLILPATYSENPPPITASGSASNPIIFQSSNPTIHPLLTPSGGTDSYGFKLEAADFVTFDGIDIANRSGFTNLQYGFWLNFLPSNAATYNTIQNCHITLAGADSNRRGINCIGNSTAPNIGNSFINNHISNCQRAIHAFQSGENLLIHGNTIIDAVNCGIYHSFGNASLSSNQISMSNSSTFIQYSIYVTGSSTNINVITANTIEGGNTNQNSFGIYLAQGQNTVRANRISNLLGRGSDTLIQSGIYCQNGNANIEQNNIENLSYTGSAANVLSAIHIEGGASHSIYNNMISNLIAPASTAIPQIRAISINSGSGIDIAHNTVFLDALGSVTSFSTATLYIGGGSNIAIRNNIFINHSIAGSANSSRSIAFWKNPSGFSNISSLTDRNIYHAGSPSTKNLICGNSSTSYQTLADYKTANTGKDQASFTEAVSFVSNSNPYDLHLDPSLPTLAEGNATPIEGINLDYDFESRNITNPDIGADEGNFCPFGDALATPILYITVNNINVQLSWDPIPNATAYQVYCSDNPDSFPVYPTATVYTNSLSLPLADRMFFRIKGIN